MHKFGLSRVKRPSVAPALRCGPTGDTGTDLRAIGCPPLLADTIKGFLIMKVWFYIALLNADGVPIEYAIKRTKAEFIKHEIEELLKFSGSAKRVEAYEIRPEKLRPSFAKPFAVATPPF